MTPLSAQDSERLREAGWLRVANLVDTAELARLSERVDALLSAGDSPAAGLRNLLRDDATLAAFARSDAALGLVRSILGPAARAVRMILFDKSPGANWGVPWHQDVNIAVAGGARPEGYGPWTSKGGAPHVVPPSEVLESMLALRLHLDDCGEKNGPLRVAPGTHRLGKATPTPGELAAFNEASVACVASAGDAILMRPLLFHSSRKATVESRRRVVHVEYAAGDLPDGLRWFFAA
jgi:hypothetical protein